MVVELVMGDGDGGGGGDRCRWYWWEVVIIVSLYFLHASVGSRNWIKSRVRRSNACISSCGGFGKVMP